MASFIKLGDIKGEFAGAYSNSLGGFRECSALFTTGGGGDRLTDAGLVFPGLYDLAGYEGSGTATCMSNGLDCDRNEHGIIIDNPGTAPHLGSTSGPGGSSFMTETFEPAAGMNSFGESLNPVLEVGGTSGPGGSTFMTGQFEMLTDNISGQAGPGGTTF